MSFPTPFDSVLDLSAAAPPLNVGKAAQAADVQLATGIGLITSITWCESSGSAACHARLLDGTDTSGAMIAAVGGASSASGDAGPGLPGIYFRNGLFLHVVAGQLDFTVQWIPLRSPAGTTY